jgi:hypothetical protein
VYFYTASSSLFSFHLLHRLVSCWFCWPCFCQSVVYTFMNTFTQNNQKIPIVAQSRYNQSNKKCPGHIAF